MERKYRLCYNDGYDNGDIEFYSSYRAGSKKNKVDAKQALISHFGYKYASRMEIKSIYLI